MLKHYLRLNLIIDNEDFKNLAKTVFDYLNSNKSIPKSMQILDYGCGTAVYSEILRQRGFNIMAFDVNKLFRDYAKNKFPELTVLGRLRKADLMLFIEVAEHMTDAQILKALEAISPKFIYFSSTPHKADNDHEWGHVNLKSESEWLDFFGKLGYVIEDRPNTPTPWAMLLKKI